jgi:hypothetical protein
LASGFSSFWQSVAPLGDAFVRELNTRYASAFAQPLRGRGSPQLRGFTNEMAFLGFRASRERGIDVWAAWERAEFVDELRMEALQRVEALTRSAGGEEPGRAEVAEARAVAERLERFFERRGGILTFSPHFPGCGVIEPCEGDVLAGDTLFEVKAGERKFRANDLRQLLVYCALSRAANIGRTMAGRTADQPRIHRVGLLNPREGLVFEDALSEVAALLGCASEAALLDGIVEFAAGELASNTPLVGDG